ncbi:F-box/kelch-repeat protein SKIP25 [Malania oleifera]|uniref:F-box/kelch-repeat protein SKIP25 n=1 Tax=Malania oleifera TaxID=397392 RepID=UPI0025AE680F|nr:F-box/kelch-repeat protein SKIP25 [Malania oleifera]
MANTATAITTATANATSTKRRKLADQTHHRCRNRPHLPPLLPGLPDHIAELCLSLLPPSLLFSVCRSWRHLLSSPSFPPYLSLYLLSSSSSSSSLHFFSFDPIFSRWHRIPPPPLRPLLRHPSFLSRNFSVQSLAVSDNLLLLAATGPGFLPALHHPLVFRPNSQSWDFGPSLEAPRRWCVAGTAAGAVFAASGIGSHYTIDMARSVEKWEMKSEKEEWAKMRDHKDGSKFSREAIDAVGWRGKLCMVNEAKEGAVYNVERDEWGDMPEGMVAGWRGPTAAMEEEVLYSVDEARGALMKYDPGRDGWEEVVRSERLRGAEQMAARGGRVCIVCSGGRMIVVVDVVETPARMWVVDPPSGYEAVAVHVLPRMTTVQ